MVCGRALTEFQAETDGSKKGHLTPKTNVNWTIQNMFNVNKIFVEISQQLKKHKFTSMLITTYAWYKKWMVAYASKGFYVTQYLPDTNDISKPFLPFHFICTWINCTWLVWYARATSLSNNLPPGTIDYSPLNALFLQCVNKCQIP